MTTATKCRAKNPAACTDPNCPERLAFLQDVTQQKNMTAADFNAFARQHATRSKKNMTDTEYADLKSAATAELTGTAQEFLGTDLGENFDPQSLEIDDTFGERFWLTVRHDFYYQGGWQHEGNVLTFTKDGDISLPDPWDE